MLVTVNGSEMDILADASIQKLLQIKNLAAARVVVELNGDIVKSGKWESTKLKAGDCLEIIRFVGGG